MKIFLLTAMIVFNSIILVYSFETNNKPVGILPIHLIAENMINPEQRELLQSRLIDSIYRNSEIDIVFVPLDCDSETIIRTIENRQISDSNEMINQSSCNYILHFELIRLYYIEDIGFSGNIYNDFYITLKISILSIDKSSLIYQETYNKNIKIDVTNNSDQPNFANTFLRIGDEVSEIINRTGFLQNHFVHASNNNIIVHFNDINNIPRHNEMLNIFDARNNSIIGAVKMFYSDGINGYGYVIHANTDLLNISEHINYTVTGYNNLDFFISGGISINITKDFTETGFYPALDIRIYIPANNSFFKPSIGADFFFFYEEGKLIMPINIYAGFKVETFINRFSINLGLNAGSLFAPDKDLKYSIDSIYVSRFIGLGFTINKHSAILLEISYNYYNLNRLFINWKKDLSGLSIKAGPVISF